MDEKKAMEIIKELIDASISAGLMKNLESTEQVSGAYHKLQEIVGKQKETAKARTTRK